MWIKVYRKNAKNIKINQNSFDTGGGGGGYSKLIHKNVEKGDL